MTDELITLNSGKAVTLDEFMSWSQQKQTANLAELPQSDEKRAKLSALRKGVKTGPLPDVTKDKIKNKLKGTFHGVPVPKIMTPIGIFDSRTEAAKGCGVGRDALRRYMKNRPTEYYVISPTTPQPTPPRLLVEPGIVVETVVEIDDDTKPPTWFLNFYHASMRWQKSNKSQLNTSIPYDAAVNQCVDDFCKSLGWNLCVREVQLNEPLGKNIVCHLFVFHTEAVRTLFMQKYA
jgi:hypothetical protein